MIFDEIWKMQRRLNKLNKAYLKRVESLRRDHKQTEEEIDMLMDDERNAVNELSININYAQSDALVDAAYSLKVPMPARTDEESWNEFFGRPYLTNKGYSDLRSKIRQERKDRRETVTAIVKDIISPIGALIISILSLLIAYAAVKLKH
jgi:hypothetical protein